MNISKVNINLIKANPSNPRLIKDESFKKLVRSVKDFPEMLSIRPIVVNKQMIVLGGNMRLKACIEAGLKEVYIIKADKLTPEQEREFIIKDNVSGGDWDWDILANEWDAEKLEGWGLEIPNILGGEIEDKSEKLNSKFAIEIECEDEEQQKVLYNKFLTEGLNCRILTL